MDYKNQLQEHFQGKNVIDLTTLIEGIVVLFGNTKDIKRDNPSIVITSSKMHISEDNLNIILNQLLTEDGTDMALAINNSESFNKLKWEYNIQEGQGYITIKNKKKEHIPPEDNSEENNSEEDNSEEDNSEEDNSEKYVSEEYVSEFFINIAKENNSDSDNFEDLHSNSENYNTY